MKKKFPESKSFEEIRAKIERDFFTNKMKQLDYASFDSTDFPSMPKGTQDQAQDFRRVSTFKDEDIHNFLEAFKVAVSEKLKTSPLRPSNKDLLAWEKAIGGKTDSGDTIDVQKYLQTISPLEAH